MKLLTIFFSAFMMMTLCSIAQPPNGPPRGGHGGPWEHGRMAPPGEEPASPFHKIMEELREQNPEKFDQLQELRRTDPKAFREESQKIMHELALKKLEAEKPEIYSAVIQLSEENQKWLLDTMTKSKLLDHIGMRGRKSHGKNLKTERKQIGKLLKQYHTSESDEEMKSIRAELKGYITAQYDQRLEMRTEQLQEMEKNIEQIQHALEQAEQDKEEFVEEKLKILLQGDWQMGKQRGHRLRD